MSASYALLGILGRRPGYGYDLKKEYDVLYGAEHPLAFGQVYATLSRLLRDNKIENEANEQDKGPARKKYVITPLGRTELEAWLGTPEIPTTATQVTFFTKVVSALLLDKSPRTFLDAQRTAHLKRMRELTELRREGDLAQLLRADHEIFHLEADLRWMDLTISRLDSLKKELQ